MKCVSCGSLDSKVVDSRLNEDGTSIRRRRECNVCGKRFTTYETIETTPIMVVKKSGARQAFSSAKLKQGIMRACEKRPVSVASIDTLVEDIEKNLSNGLEQEVSSSKIGEMVMDRLKEIDQVSYVRFASVYREFKDVQSWLSEINEMVGGKNKYKK